MLNSSEIQRAYIRLYTALRDYMWDFRTVEAIVDVEVAAYQQFPDIDKLKRKLNSLNTLIYSTAREDKELKSAMEDFQKLLEDEEELYSPLETFKEVVSVENK